MWRRACCPSFSVRLHYGRAIVTLSLVLLFDFNLAADLLICRSGRMAADSAWGGDYGSTVLIAVRHVM
jgi:hypothetical protein